MKNKAKYFKPKICIVCGIEFIPVGPKQKYCKICSLAMRKERQIKYNLNRDCKTHLNELRTCQQCGKEFIPKSGPQKYCSKECRTISKYNRRKRYRSKTHLNEIRICKICGNEFLPHSGTQKYCKECRSIVFNEKARKFRQTEKGKLAHKKSKVKRYRNLDFIPLNKPFEGSEAHHIDKDRVIYIPKEIHQSIRHNVWTGRNMVLINNLAYDYLLETKVSEAQGGA